MTELLIVSGAISLVLLLVSLCGRIGPDGSLELLANGALDFARTDHPFYSLSLGPEAGTMLVRRPRGACELRDLRTGEVLHREEFPGFSDNLSAQSADGRLVVLSAGDALLCEVSGPPYRIEMRVDGNMTLKALDLTPDGRLAAVGYDDGKIRLWDPQTGRQLLELEGRGGKPDVVAVRLSNDGSRIAASRNGGWIGVWTTDDGSPLHAFSAEGSARALALSADGRHLAAGCTDGTICVWDLKSGEELWRSLPEAIPTKCLVFSPDGRQLINCSGAMTTVRAIDSGQRIADLSGHQRLISCLAIHPDGRLLYSGSHDGTLRIWDLKTATELRSLR